MLLELDKDSLILDQEDDAVLEDVLAWLKDLIYDVDDLSLRYIELEVLKEG